MRSSGAEVGNPPYLLSTPASRFGSPGDRIADLLAQAVRLIFLPKHRGAAIPHEVSGTPVRVWRDPQGRPAVYGYREGETWAIDVPGVAAFRFARQGDVAVAAHPGAARSRIRDVYRRGVLPLVLQYRGREILHASAVIGSGGVVGLCGVSGTGKSTIAYGLGLRGHQVWADDALVFRVTAAMVETLPLGFGLRLRPAAARHFGLLRRSAGEIVGAGGGEDGRNAARPLVAVCVLQRGRGPAPSAAEAVPLGAVQALIALLPHAYCLDLDDLERKSRMMHQYLDLAGRVPVFSIKFSDGLESLGGVLDAVERVARAAPVPEARRNGHLTTS